MDRRDEILAGIKVDELVGLEIGPLDKALVERRPGRRIFYADYAPRAELRAKSADDPGVNIEAIPEIDFVCRDLGDYRGIELRFDYVIASHVVEHAPDVLGWFNMVLGLLRRDGVLVLAIPDRRYTFDYFRPESTLGDVLEAYFELRKIPSFRQVFDGNGMARRVDTAQAWKSAPDLNAERYFDVATVLWMAKNSLFECTHYDCHCWVFTYESFLKIIEELDELLLLPVDVVLATPPRPFLNEFYVRLSPRRTD